MGLTLEAVQVVDTIARKGSFSAAAQALGKVPSALTYTVRKLEDDLDVLLFDRRGNRARLTPAGEQLLRQGRELLRAADDLACRVKGVASGWEVELRVAVDASIAFERIRPLIEEFHALTAPTQLRFMTEVLDGSWDALLTARADLVIGAANDAPVETRTAGRFSQRPLGEVAFVFCVAPHHPLAAITRPLTDEDLLAHRAIAVADTSRSLPPRTVGLLGGQPLLTVATMEQKVALQVAGVGVGYLPEPFARAQLRAGRLVEREVAGTRRSEALRYAWRTGDRGKALHWWLEKLGVPLVRERLLSGPLLAPVSERQVPTPESPAPGEGRKKARSSAGSSAARRSRGK